MNNKRNRDTFHFPITENTNFNLHCIHHIHTQVPTKFDYDSAHSRASVIGDSTHPGLRHKTTTARTQASPQDKSIYAFCAYKNEFLKGANAQAQIS